MRFSKQDGASWRGNAAALKQDIEIFIWLHWGLKCFMKSKVSFSESKQSQGQSRFIMGHVGSWSHALHSWTDKSYRLTVISRSNLGFQCNLFGRHACFNLTFVSKILVLEYTVMQELNNAWIVRLKTCSSIQPAAGRANQCSYQSQSWNLEKKIRHLLCHSLFYFLQEA